MRRSLYIAAVIIAGLFALAVKFPLNWLGGNMAALSGGVVVGTPWRGGLLTRGAFPDFELRTSPVTLMKGEGGIDIRSINSPISFLASAGLSRIKTLQLTSDIYALDPADGRLRGLSGDVSFTLDGFPLRAACTEGQIYGQAQTRILADNAAQWQWSGPVLSGPIRCENAELTAALTGADSDSEVFATIAFLRSGLYKAEITVSSRDPRAGSVLPYLGFERRAGGDYRLAETGKWL